ncbi:MAG: class I SAM-dependent methyltransferase [Planctomycetota bacterium]
MEKTVGKWDEYFKVHLERAKESGIDLNESVEKDWSGTKEWAERFIEPFMPENPDAICEIGPGTGRHSRLYIDRTKTYYLADYSDFVLDTLRAYFKSKPQAVYVKTTHSRLDIPSDSCDFAFSIGTFVHLYIEQIYGYLKELHRILKIGGRAVIHFANFMDDAGYHFFVEKLPSGEKYDHRSIFRFYHPEMLEKMSETIGFETLALLAIEGQRHCFLALQKNLGRPARMAIAKTKVGASLASLPAFLWTYPCRIE